MPTSRTIPGVDHDIVETGEPTWDNPEKWLTREVVPKPGSRGANEQAMLESLQSSLDINVTYLGRKSPTAAQNTAQIQHLTRSFNALVKLQLQLLEDTTGT